MAKEPEMTPERLVLAAIERLSKDLRAQRDEAEIVATIVALIDAKVSLGLVAKSNPQADHVGPRDLIQISIDAVSPKGSPGVTEPAALPQYARDTIYAAQRIVEMCTTWGNSQQDQIAIVANALHSLRLSGVDFCESILFRMIPHDADGEVVNTPAAFALCTALATIESRSEKMKKWSLPRDVAGQTEGDNDD